MYRIGIQILSFNKPQYLKKTLESLIQKIGQDDKICVVEQSDQPGMQEECIEVCKQFPNVRVIPLFKNFGQRGATNILYETGFWSDCDYVMLSDHDNIFHDDLTVYVNILRDTSRYWIATGYHSPEHDSENKDGFWIIKSSCRAGHIVMRKSDFYSLMPSDLKAGSASWFAGLDWWISHWAPTSPGHKRQQFVACLPGGVEHIGRESTWQGKYDDEYSFDDLIWIRTADFVDIIKKYPPRHAYIKEPYWYETSEVKEVKSNELKKLPKVLAFNYMWPKYGLTFLKRSIAAILPHVDKYILYLNRYSYIGTPCDDSDFEYAKKICESFDDKVLVYINEESNFPEHAQKDNIGFYFKVAGQLAKNENYDYVWLVQSDEVYDKEVLSRFNDYLNNGSFKNKCSIFSLICYMDNPHWRVSPAEEVNRPSFIDVQLLEQFDYDYFKLQKTIYSDIFFHHMSYVLTTSELLDKVNNWGHRHNFNDEIKTSFLKKFDYLKVNKRLTHLNPIIPHLYDHVEFVDNEINRQLYLDWIYFLLTYKNPYDSISSGFANTVTDFPKDPDNIYNLTEIERKLISSIMIEFLPVQSNIFEYGSWTGYNFMLMRILNVHSTITSVDNYGKADVLFQQYDDQLDRVYKLACKRLLDFKLPNVYLFNGNTKFPSIIKNESLDFVFINNGINGENMSNCLIELWPKLKDGSIICGHYSLNGEILSKLKNIVSHNVVVKCPWGQEVFDYYEIYYNVFKDIEQSLNVTLPNNLGMWIARVKK